MLFQSSQLAPHYSDCGCYCQTAEMHRIDLRSKEITNAPHTLLSRGTLNQCGESQGARLRLGHTGCSGGGEELKRDDYSDWGIN